MHILDLWAPFVNQSAAPINALNIYSLYLLCSFMIYTRAVFGAEGSRRSHVCPRISSAVKLFFLLDSLHKKHADHRSGHLSIQNKQPQSSSVAHPDRFCRLKSQRANKDIFCGSKVSQQKQTKRGLFCTTGTLAETLRVPLCHPAHALEVAFPPEPDNDSQDELSLSVLLLG